MTGNEILERIKRTLPARWWRHDAPARDAIVGGIADSLAWCSDFLEYARLQTRIATATDSFLDLIGFDFFGLRVRRKKGQPDESWRRTIKAEIFRERVTRRGVKKAVEDLTQNPVRLFEVFNAQDTGGFGRAWAFNEPLSMFGSSNYPWSFFLDVKPPVGAGIKNLSGFNDPPSGFANAAAGPDWVDPEDWSEEFVTETNPWGDFAFADQSLITGEVTPQDIRDTINAARAAGVTCWLNLEGFDPSGDRIEDSFAIGESEIS